MSSPYEIVLDRGAIMDLKKLAKSQPKIIKQIELKIDALAHDPYLGKALHGDKKGIYSLRHGDYRILYECYHEKRTVLVITIGDRKEVYA
ncbi:MAG: type II toxin-antitoxin system RelE/ParE family toxin [Deltaproteobacteria bacterium]|nr:type II toxin-antitoxin system RelE/ParE family toxin [Deltaproteobacteria bacterium]